MHFSRNYGKFLIWITRWDATYIRSVEQCRRFPPFAPWRHSLCDGAEEWMAETSCAVLHSWWISSFGRSFFCSFILLSWREDGAEEWMVEKKKSVMKRRPLSQGSMVNSRAVLRSWGIWKAKTTEHKSEWQKRRNQSWRKDSQGSMLDSRTVLHSWLIWKQIPKV